MVEILDGIASHPTLDHLVTIRWLDIVELDIQETVRAVQFKAELGGDPTRDLGECAVLALAEARAGTAVIDDRDAAALGRRYGVSVVGTLAVIAGAFKRSVIEREAAEALVDD